MASHTLVIPFLTDEPLYTHGVEFGMLYVQMRDTEEPISGYFTIENQDQILLAASRMGWRVIKMEPWENQWFWLEMEKPSSSDG